MVDYDLFYDELNIVQLNTNILLDHGRTAYLNAFMRKTPILATSNALIGRQEKTIDELKKTLNIEQIYQLARDRTADSQLITVGGTQPINEKFQATVDLTFSRIDATIASGGVAATESTGTDYFLSAQLVGNNILLKRDTGVLGIRYSDTKLSDTLSLIANSRFLLSRNWRVNPRLQYDFRGFRNGSSQRKIRVLLKTDYRYINRVRFDFDIGYDDTNREANGQTGTNNLFFRLGYRWDF
jgi:maltoporin